MNETFHVVSRSVADYSQSHVRLQSAAGTAARIASPRGPCGCTDVRESTPCQHERNQWSARRSFVTYMIISLVRICALIQMLRSPMPPPHSPTRSPGGRWPLPELIMRSVCSASACFDIDIDCSVRLAARRFICEQWSIDCCRYVSSP